MAYREQHFSPLPRPLLQYQPKKSPASGRAFAVLAGAAGREWRRLDAGGPSVHSRLVVWLYAGRWLYARRSATGSWGQIRRGRLFFFLFAGAAALAQWR